MNQSTTLRSLTITITIVLLSACASASKPLGEWRDDGFSGQVDNILIIGVTSRSTRRRVFEDQYVAALGAAGVNALPSYMLIESSMHLTRDVVERAIKGQNIDAVLVTRLVGVKEEAVYKLPANYDDERGYMGYYDHAWKETSTGYNSQYQVFTLETTLYDTVSGKLIWSMQSEVMDRSQPRHVIKEQIELAIESIGKQGLIAAKP